MNLPLEFVREWYDDSISRFGPLKSVFKTPLSEPNALSSSIVHVLGALPPLPPCSTQPFCAQD